MNAKPPVGDWFNLFWVLNFFTALMAIIWIVSLHSPHTYSLLLVIVLVSHVWHKDLWREIGFWPQQIVNARLLGLLGLTLVFGGLLWIFIGPSEFLTVRDVMLKIIVGSGWGLVQQYALNGFVLNRLIGSFGSVEDRRIPWIAASLFSLVHAPNWFLMSVTFTGGYLCARIFLKERNLYFLGLAHGIISFLLLWFLPERLTRNFIIGLGYFSK